MHGAQEGWTWALRDVSFTAGPGESVGIVGRNGSGKTTLLRLLAGVMYPYAGRVDLTGKLGTLINMSAGLQLTNGQRHPLSSGWHSWHDPVQLC